MTFGLKPPIRSLSLSWLHPGLNWHVRTGSKYTCPTSIETLRQHNRVYIHKKLQQNHVDPHWQLMATEIATEVKQGRMAGPFQAPGWLQTKTSPLKKHSHTSNLLPLPHPDPWPSASNRPGQMENRRFDEAKIGDALDTTKHVI